MSQHQLAKLVSCSQGTIWALEAGYRKKVPIDIAKKLIELDNFPQLLGDMELKSLSAKIGSRGRFTFANASEFASKGGFKGAITTAAKRKPTFQEQYIMEALKKENLPFATQVLIMGKSRRFIVDFAIPSENSTKIIIEAKSLPNKFGKDLQMISLAWRIIKIREKFPNVFILVWLNGKIPKSVLQIVKDEADYVAYNEPVEKTIEIIRSVTKHRSQI